MNYRYPQLREGNARDQVQQMSGFLFQLVEQLNMAEQLTESRIQEVSRAALSPSTSESDTQKALNTFNSIKTLIIKSADIVTAYEEVMEKTFSGMYVAQSDFGTFSEATQTAIQANSENIELKFQNLQEISAAVDELTANLIAVNARIRTGLLDDTVTPPIYGVEVGQTVVADGQEIFNKFARFTADRLSFYDSAGNEVAYISDFKLYITRAEVTGSLRIGGYEIESGNGIVFKWKGA